MNHPATPKKLVGTKWTAAEGHCQHRHYEVIALEDDHAILRPVLEPEARLRMPWRELRERSNWQPGWKSVD